MSRKIINSIMLSAAALFAMSCDFQEINTDPNKATQIEPGPLLTYTQMNTSWDAHSKNMQVGMCMMLVQQTASLNTTEVGVGDKYIKMDAPCNQYFIDMYSNCIKNLREMEYVAGQKPEYVKMLGVAKIWGAYLFQRMTDLYGDVPYTEAGLGFHGKIYKPAYDSQKDIYDGLIAQVREGLGLIKQEGDPIQGDLFYDGDVEKWTKFGNSVLLHLGMRLCKVDPETAKKVAGEAIAGGIMKKAEESARIKHDAKGREDVQNQVSLRFKKDQFIKNDAVKISKTFMDYLKATNDPRIKVLCSLKDGNDTTDVQFGLPNGYDNNNISSFAGFKGLDKYSNFNTKTIMDLGAPTILMTASETRLLEAEAILRGWAAGDAEAVFNEAIKTAMAEQKHFYGVEIAKADVNAFIAQDLFKNASGEAAKMEVLGCQYWVTTFMNGYESFANWRRCGYPVLTATSYSGNYSDGTVPRRLLYSIDEKSINGDHVNEAIKRQGADNVNTRVWWDKK